MRTQVTIAFVIISTILITLIWHHPAQGEMTDEQYYSRYVDRYIERCAFKDKQHSGSCLISLNKYGALNCLKAAFVGYYKDVVVNNLIYYKVGREDYKLDHYINGYFYEIFRLAAEDIRDQYNAAIEGMPKEE